MNWARRSGEALIKVQMLAVGGNREARLGARLYAFVAGPRQPAHRATAIPLRKAAARRGTEDDGGQAPHSLGIARSLKDANYRTRPADSR